MIDEIKKCPFCGGDIGMNVRKCRHCGEWLTQQSPGCSCTVTFLAWTIGIIVLLANWSGGFSGILAKTFAYCIGLFKGKFWMGLFWALCAIVLVEVYCIPTRIALKRKHKQQWLIIALNAIGFILPIWFCALILACVRCRGENSIW